MAGKARKSQKGMGFRATAKSVARRSGKPMKQAQAIIAAGARNASPAAKKANPNLKKVTGKKAAPTKRQRQAAKTAAARRARKTQGGGS